jgi:hypothetical protein
LYVAALQVEELQREAPNGGDPVCGGDGAYQLLGRGQGNVDFLVEVRDRPEDDPSLLGSPIWKKRPDRVDLDGNGLVRNYAPDPVFSVLVGLSPLAPSQEVDTCRRILFIVENTVAVPVEEHPATDP